MPSSGNDRDMFRSAASCGAAEDVVGSRKAQGTDERARSGGAFDKLPSTQLDTVIAECSTANAKSAATAKPTSNTVPFDPKAPELATSWHSAARIICCINTYPNGISFSIHKNDGSESAEAAEMIAGPAAEHGQSNGEQKLAEGKAKFSPNQFHLRLRDTRDINVPAGRFFLYREKYAEALEHNLSQLYKKDLLASTVVYLGFGSDPFLALDKKFDVTHACLQVLAQYRPGLVVAQTRSPMVISALPLLKMLGDRAVVAIPIESPHENIIARYTPGQPKIRERLIAAEGLRRQGIQVNLMASPILPYGDFYRDAWDFAALLNKHADFISLGSLCSGMENEEAMLRHVPLAQKLASDRQFRWLRPHSYRCLYYALKTVAPEKLQLPVRVRRESAQLKLFAA